jgi:hypothetical protein
VSNKLCKSDRIKFRDWNNSDRWRATLNKSKNVPENYTAWKKKEKEKRKNRKRERRKVYEKGESESTAVRMRQRGWSDSLIEESKKKDKGGGLRRKREEDRAQIE